VYVYSTVSGVSLIMALFCAIVGCANRGDRDKEKRFFRLPSVSAHQGDQTRELSERRREAWLPGRTEASRLKARKLPVCPCLFRSFCEWNAVQPLWCTQPRLGSIAESLRYERNDGKESQETRG